MKQDKVPTKVNIYFDKRSYSKKYGGHPIKFKLYHKKSHEYLRTGYYCDMRYWIFGDKENQEYIKSFERNEIIYISKKHPNGGRLNKQISLKLTAARDFVLKNEASLNDFSSAQLKDALQKVIENLESGKKVEDLIKTNISIIESFENQIESLEPEEDDSEDKHFKTRSAYNSSLNTYKSYFEEIGIEDIDLIDIDKSWLTEFSNWYSKQPGKNGGTVKANSVNKKLNQLSKLITDACNDKDQKITLNSHPFNGFELPRNKTRKKAIRLARVDEAKATQVLDFEGAVNIVDLFRQLNLEIGSEELNIRNYLLFMFNMRGMDLIDIAYLKRENILNNTVEYSRSKVKDDSHEIVEMTTEAREILDFYNYLDKQPGQLVFPIIASCYEEQGGRTKYVEEKYELFRKKFNNTLTKFANQIGIEGRVTSKAIRHTWASIGFDLSKGNRGIVKEGLGHRTEQTGRIYTTDLATSTLSKLNEEVTNRASVANSETSVLIIDLSVNFGKSKQMGSDPNEFRDRLLKKIRSYEVEEKLQNQLGRTLWISRLEELEGMSFLSIDEVELWLHYSLKSICQFNGIRLYTGSKKSHATSEKTA